MTELYWVSLSIIIGSAIYAVLAPCVKVGAVGMVFIGGAAVFAVKGFEYDPPRWLTLMLACLAGAALCAIAGWWRFRRDDCCDSGN